MYTYNDFFNRDLSWLEFNNRVLEEAEKKSNPLFEQLKFLAISSSNLDEFFMIRVSGLIAQLKENYGKLDISGRSPLEQLNELKKELVKFTAKQDKIFNNIKEQLKNENVIFSNYDNLPEELKNECSKYYKGFIFPVVTPLAVDASRPFPLLLNKSLNIIVKVNKDGEDHFCIIQVPQIIKRIKEFQYDKKIYLVQIEEIIVNNMESLFEGYTVVESALFKLTRDAEMIIDEDEAEDLLIEIKNSLLQRKWGDPVRLEVNKNTPKAILNFLIETFDNPYLNVIEYSSPLELNFLFEVYGLNGFDKFS